MKAIIVKEPGGLEQLAIAELPDPTPGPDEVVIAVAYSGLNWADTMIRVGTYPHPFTYPVIPGLEAAGRIAAIGPGVANVKLGDRVAGFNEKGGSYAEKFVVPKDWIFSLPAGIPFEIGAAFPSRQLSGKLLLRVGAVS